MRVFGIDPGSNQTGYGCVDSDGRRHRLVRCGAIRAADAGSFPDRLAAIYRELTVVLRECEPECVAIENLFHATNVRSALRLGHARGIAMLAAVEAGLPVVEYTPAEIKRAVVGYGRAEKPQIGRMIKLLLGLDAAPSPHDAADALAVAICHVHAGFGSRGGTNRLRPDSTLRASSRSRGSATREGGQGSGRQEVPPSNRFLNSWRHYKPPSRARQA